MRIIDLSSFEAQSDSLNTKKAAEYIGENISTLQELVKKEPLNNWVFPGRYGVKFYAIKLLDSIIDSQKEKAIRV